MGTSGNIYHVGLTRQFTITASFTDMVLYVGSLNNGDVYLKGVLATIVNTVPTARLGVTQEVYLPAGTPYGWLSLPFASPVAVSPCTLAYIITCRATNATDVYGVMATDSPTLPWQQEAAGISYASPPSDLSGYTWVTLVTEEWPLYGNLSITSIPWRGHGPYG